MRNDSLTPLTAGRQVRLSSRSAKNADALRRTWFQQDNGQTARLASNCATTPSDRPDDLNFGVFVLPSKVPITRYTGPAMEAS